MAKNDGLTDVQKQMQDERVRNQDEKKRLEDIEGSREWIGKWEKRILGRKIIDAQKYSMITRNFVNLINVFTRYDIGYRFYSWRVFIGGLIFIIPWAIISSLAHSTIYDHSASLGIDYFLWSYIGFYIGFGIHRKKEGKKHKELIISTSHGEHLEIFYRISHKHPMLIENLAVILFIIFVGVLASFTLASSLHFLLGFAFLFKLVADGKERGMRVIKDWNKSDGTLDSKQSSFGEGKK